MKRIFTIICAIAFSGSSLSAQSVGERIDVRTEENNTKTNNVKLNIGYTF